MYSESRIEKVKEILKTVGRLRKAQLIEKIENECQVARQTAINTIDDALELGIIKEEKRWKGKELIIFYTVHFDIEENEKDIFEFCEKTLKQFDLRFEFFKGKFSSLSFEEKAIGLESFSQLMFQIHVATLALWHNFGRANEWKSLLDNVDSRTISINDLMDSGPNEERAQIKTHIIENKADLINDVFNSLDEYLDKIK